MDLLGHFLNVVLPIAGTALSMLGAWALKKLATKLHIQASTEMEWMIDSAVSKGINYAEAWAAKQSEKPLGTDKMSVAMSFIESLLGNKTVQQYGKEKLEALVEAQLIGDKKLEERLSK